MKKYLIAVLLAGTVMSAPSSAMTAAAADDGRSGSVSRKMASAGRDVRGEFDALREQVTIYTNILGQMMARDAEQPYDGAAEPRPSLNKRAEPEAVVHFDSGRRGEMRAELTALARAMVNVQALLMKRSSSFFQQALLEAAQRNAAIKAEEAAQEGLEFHTTRMLCYVEQLGEGWTKYREQESGPIDGDAIAELLTTPTTTFDATDLRAVEQALNEEIQMALRVQDQKKSDNACRILQYLMDRHAESNSAGDDGARIDVTTLPEYLGLTQRIESIFDETVAPTATRMEEIFFPERVAERRRAAAEEERVRLEQQRAAEEEERVRLEQQRVEEETKRLDDTSVVARASDKLSSDDARRGPPPNKQDGDDEGAGLFE